MAAASSAATRDLAILAGPRDRRLTPEPRGRPRDRPVPRFTAAAGAATEPTANGLHIKTNYLHAISNSKQGACTTSRMLRNCH